MLLAYIAIKLLITISIEVEY